MTGWIPAVTIKTFCQDYEPSTGLLSAISPGLCAAWLGCHCERGHVCPWLGQPPEKGEEDGYEVRLMSYD